MLGTTPEEKANIAPFLTFLGLIMLGQLVGKPFEGRQVFWALQEPGYWVNPAQALICGAMVLRWRRFYDFSAPKQPLLALLAGLAAIAVWLAPQFLPWQLPEFLQSKGRYSGFDPYFFGSSGPAFWLNISLRFLKLVVVVPIIEEIFWRNFLLRWMIDQDFTRVPFGTFTWTSFLVVTAGFTIEHQMADYPAAVITAVLYNLIAIRTKSLTSCILAHAATNLLLGAYVLYTGQWGFW